MMLLLGCVVMCEGKGPLIEKMKSMQLLQQQALVAHIQQVRKPPYVFRMGFMVVFVYVLVVVCMACMFCCVSPSDY